MKMLGYYALHSFKNIIRKLFKTWIAVFIGVCFLMGLIIGVGAGLIADNIDSAQTDSSQVDVIDDSADAVIADEGGDAVTITYEQKLHLIELIAGAVILFIIVLCAFTSDKSVASLFLPADVPLLFASPLKPQTVLIFRLSMQLGLIVVSSIYILFQLPNLINNLGLSVWNAFAVILTWFFTFAWGKILQVFLYIFGSTHEKFKQNLRYIIIGILVATGLAFYGYYKSSNQDLLSCNIAFFNGRFTYLIPVWGWLKAIIAFGIKGQYLWQCAAIFANILFAVIFVYFIWQMKADYYEEALAKCEETAALMEAMKEGKRAKRNKKDRSEKLIRDGLNKGFGANIYFYKSMYNRFRFAHLRFFTKTAELYLAISILVSLELHYVFEANLPVVVFIALALAAFFRSLGNSLQEDTKTDYFILIPESIWAKMIYSMLGALTNCVLDLLPGMIAACLILRENPLTAVLWAVLIVSIYFYSTSVGAFIDFSIPTSAGITLKKLVQVLFVYFGLLPDILCIVLAAVFSQMWIGILFAIIINCIIGGIFFSISPLFLTNGRK